MLCPIITDGPPQPSTKREAKEFQDAQVCLKPAGISFFLDAVPNIFFHVFSDGFFCFHDGVSMFSSGWSWCRKAYIHAAPNAGSAPMTAGGPGTMCDRFDREIQIVYFDTVCCSIIYFPTCQVRVVRFYQSCSSPPRLALRKVI